MIQEPLLRLSNGDLHLSIRPDLGGSIVGLWRGQQALLRGAANDAKAQALQDVRLSACYPLVPYSNRIAHAAFGFRGRHYALRRNFGNHPHSLHGLAWQRPWRVLAQPRKMTMQRTFCTSTLSTFSLAHPSPPVNEGVENRENRESIEAVVCTLALDYQPSAQELAQGVSDWPFAFAVEQDFVLWPDALELRLRLRNTSEHETPVGLGWHPYFIKQQCSTLRFQAQGRWQNDAHMLPSTFLTAADEAAQIGYEGYPGYAYAVHEVQLDHCFAGWQGEAVVQFAEGSMRLSSDMSYLVVFIPPDKNHFCVEPVSHRNNAIHSEDPVAHGLRVLAPFASTSAWMRLEWCSA